MSSDESAELPAPAEVRRISRRLQGAGYSTWAVGGAVRDALAGNVPGDWDLTTAARPGQVQALFRRTVPVGIEHGTVGVLGKDGRLYEVTTFRRDVETFGRKARVVFADTLEEDLERRDFTINAVAWDPSTGELRDPHGGVGDLRGGLLRTVGDPNERFAEDRLRVLRALRFAGRFQLRIDPRTWEAIRASADQLLHLSAERVREELYKVLRGPRPPSTALRLYQESGVLAHLYPELAACVGEPDGEGEGDVWSHLIATVDAVPRSRPTLRVAALLHDAGKPVARAAAAGAGSPHEEHAAAGAARARELLRRLKASNAETDRVAHLVAQHSGVPGEKAGDGELRRWIRLVGPGYVRDVFRLRFAECRARRGDALALIQVHRRVRALLRQKPALEIGDLAIGGAELRALGIPPGPRFGEILRDLLERVTDDPTLNSRDRLTRIVREENG